MTFLRPWVVRGGAGESARGVRATAFCGTTAAKDSPKPPNATPSSKSNVRAQGRARETGDHAH